jgi:hypothetical protein
MLSRAFMFFALFIGLATPAPAGDRTNLPLRNWGGGSVYRDWVYDGLERLALAGFTDRIVLNTKPLSRVEAARIVSQAIEAIRKDTVDITSGRPDLEDLVDRLVDEFAPELVEMGAISRNGHAAPAFFSLKPVDKLQSQLAYANNRTSLVNSQGADLRDGFNGRVGLESRAQIGDFLSFYLHPEFHSNEDFTAVRLVSGYAKLTLFNVELEVGRDSLWWGPGFRGSMLLSNNAAPLDQIRIGTAEPIRLPWLLDYIGPVKAVFFVAQLEQSRDFPYANLTGIRLNIAPSRYLELGLGRVVQFGGKGRGTTAGDFPRIFFTDGSDDPTSPVSTNNLLSLDATLRIPNAGRYIFIARDLMLYGEMGWDDTVTGVFVPDRPGALMGTLLSGLFGSPDTDFRLEYAQTSTLSFTHFLYTTGYSYRGDVLSHFIGTDGWDLYSRLVHRLTSDLTAGLELERAEIGSVASGGVNKPREKRTNFGVDLSWEMLKNLWAFGAYTFSRVTSRNFVLGDDGDDHTLRVELRRSF